MVEVSIAGQNINTPTTSTTTVTKDTDTPTSNKDTGVSFPYIALGTIVLVAGGAYIATRNKSKMYKI